MTVDDDVANACLFLASDASRQITGVDLPVDGGWAMLVSAAIRQPPISSSATARSSHRNAVIEASVAIADGKILAVGADAAMPPARETVDAKGLHVLPGAIDVHVHFRDRLSRTRRTGRAVSRAAFGGCTTVFDMPNTIPPTANADILAAKHEIASSKAFCRYGLYGLLGADTIEHVPALVSGGVIGFNVTWATLSQNPVADNGRMLEGFEVVAKTGKRISLACRNKLDHGNAARRSCAPPAAPIRSRISHPACRRLPSKPSAAPAILSEWTGARIHIPCTSRPLMNCGRCAKPKARGVDITGEDRAALSDALGGRLREVRRRHPRSIRRCARSTIRNRCGSGTGRRHHRHVSPPTTRRIRLKKKPATTSGPSIAASPASNCRCR